MNESVSGDLQSSSENTSQKSSNSILEQQNYAVLMIVVGAISIQLLSVLLLDLLVGIDVLPVASLNIIFQIAMLFLYYYYNRKDPVDGLHPDDHAKKLGWSLKTWLMVYGAAILFSLVFNFILLRILGGGESTIAYEQLLNTPIDVVFFLISAVIFAPIVEELIFRKFIIDRLITKYGTYFAVVFSSIIFSMIHWLADLQSSTLNVFIPRIFSLFFLGLLFGVIYVKTKNILYPIILHAVNNFVSTVPLAISILYPVSEDDLNAVAAGEEVSAEVAMAASINALISLFIVALLVISVIYGLIALVKNRTLVQYRTSETLKQFRYAVSKYPIAILTSLSVLVIIPFVTSQIIGTFELSLYEGIIADIVLYTILLGLLLREYSKTSS